MNEAVYNAAFDEVAEDRRRLRAANAALEVRVQSLIQAGDRMKRVVEECISADWGNDAVADGIPALAVWKAVVNQ